MEIKRYNSTGRLHEAVIYNGTLYLAGKVSRNGGSVAEQAKDCLRILEETLEKYGSDKRHILAATVWLYDMATAPEFNAVWDAWVEEGTQPTRTCVGVTLPAGIALEITLIAAVKE